jgi:hypothetical protein
MAMAAPVVVKSTTEVFSEHVAWTGASEHARYIRPAPVGPVRRMLLVPA